MSTGAPEGMLTSNIVADGEAPPAVSADEDSLTHSNPQKPNASPPKRVVIPPGHPLHPKTKMLMKKSTPGAATMKMPPAAASSVLDAGIPLHSSTELARSLSPIHEATHTASSPAANRPATPLDGAAAARRRYAHRVLDFFKRYDPLKIPADEVVARIVSDHGPPEHIFFHILRKNYGLSLSPQPAIEPTRATEEERVPHHTRLALSMEVDHDAGSPYRANPDTTPLCAAPSNQSKNRWSHNTDEYADSQLTPALEGSDVASPEGDPDASLATSTVGEVDPRTLLPLDTWLPEWDAVVSGVMPVSDFKPFSWNTATNGSANQSGPSSRFQVADGTTPGINVAQRFLHNGKHFVVHHGKMKARADPEVASIVDRLHPYFWAEAENEPNEQLNGLPTPPPLDVEGDAYAPLAFYSTPLQLTKASKRAERRLLLRAIQRMARQTELDVFGTSSDGAVAAACYLREDRGGRRSSRTSSRNSRLSSDSTAQTPESPNFAERVPTFLRGSHSGGGGGDSPYISSLSSPPSLNPMEEDLLLLEDMDASFKSCSTARRSLPSPVEFE